MTTALKEWAVLLEAMAEGRQIFLLRKGGIAEGKRGFELKHKEFLFFPTREHQHAGAVRPEHRDLFSRLSPSDPATVEIRYFGKVSDICMAPATLDSFRRLARHHVWTDDYLRKRYEYRPDLPLFVVLVRLYRLALTAAIPNDRRYAGCRSWVTLYEDIAVEQAAAARSEGSFRSGREELLGDLKGLRSSS